MKASSFLRGGLAVLPLVIAPPLGAEELGSATAADERRLHLGLRTGFGVPLGSYAEVLDVGFRDPDVHALGDDTHGVIPLWLDAGYRLSPHLMLGGYFMFGIVLPKTAPANDPLSGGCPEGVECFATGLRFGVQAQYAFSPGQFVNPWLGLGVGYEWITTQFEGELLMFAIESSRSYSGPEFLHVQGGVDLQVAHAFAVGPFASLSAMQYTACAAELGGDEAECEVVEATWHGWLMFGVRGVLAL